MNKEENKKKILAIESKVNSMLNKFIAKDGKVASKEGFTWRNISKVQLDLYIGHDDLSLNIYFYSTGKSGNNKPYVYHKKVSKDIADKFILKLNEARKLDSTVEDDELDPINNW